VAGGCRWRWVEEGNLVVAPAALLRPSAEWKGRLRFYLVRWHPIEQGRSPETPPLPQAVMGSRLWRWERCEDGEGFAWLSVVGCGCDEEGNLVVSPAASLRPSAERKGLGLCLYLWRCPRL
jgi:hypothetical protein